MTNEKMTEILKAISTMDESHLRDIIEYAMDTLILVNVRAATAAKKSETA